MSSMLQPLLSPKEYLARERTATLKSEFLRGETFAMAGTSRKHSLIATNLIRELASQLRDRPCEVHSSDLRVKVNESGLYTYPDVSVACGDPKFEDKLSDTLLNPIVIIEVLSDSTEAYDRGAKFEHYRKLPSLRIYVLVAQDRCHVELHTRQDDGSWVLREFNRLMDSLQLPAIECRLKLADVYAKVAFPTVKVKVQHTASARKKKGSR